MRILIGTPAGGGQVTIPYFTSFLQTVEGLAKVNQTHFPNGGGIQIGIYTLTHESLISRGRNHIAQVAINGGWDKLFFIDADAGWTFDQFMAVATAPGDVVAGTCPLKCFPISMNYLPFRNDEHFYKDAVRSVESMRAMRAGHGTPLIKVPFVGTAFMSINKHVLTRMTEVCEPYQYPNPTTGQLETHWDIFKTTPVKKMYMSEDWGFCHLARENGFSIFIHADVTITHTGNYTFKCPPPPPPQAVEEGGVAPAVPVAGEGTDLAPEASAPDQASPQTGEVIMPNLDGVQQLEVVT